MGVNGIYGLSGSGIDVESMVKVGMMSKQNEYDKMAQKFTKNEWIKADYLELNNKITTFNASTLSQYKMSNTMNARSAESSSSAVKVTANSTASVMSHKVDVEKLSTNAYLVGTRSLTRYSIATNALEDGTANQTSIKLADVLYKDLSYNKNVENSTVSGYIASVDKEIAGDGHVYASAGYEFGTYTASGSVNAPTLTSTAFSFMIEDSELDTTGMTDEEIEAYKKAHTISYTFGDLVGDNGKTFNDLVADINALGLNVKASYDSVNDRFSFYNKQGGADNLVKITLSDEPVDTAKTRGRSAIATRNFFDNLGLYQSANGDITGRTSDTSKPLQFELGASNANSFAGENGIMKIDGVTYDKVTDNKVIVGGVTYTALNTTGDFVDDGNGNKKFVSAEASTVSVTQDTDAIIDKVKSFVSEYNTLLSSLYAKYDEKPNSDYKPLTQSQKDQMKEEQITKWEEKAKQGLLYHDQTLGKVIQNMRNAVSETVDGISSKYNSIYSLGISTTGIKGQLVLDEDKLKTALANDPDAVYNIFAKLESTTTNNASAVYKTDANGNVTSTSNGNGIAQRLGDIFVSANKLIKDRAGSSADITEDSDLNNLLRNLQTKMSNFKRIMNSFEDALYKKYDAMESTLAKLGMQLNYVMGSSGQ